MVHITIHTYTDTHTHSQNKHTIAPKYANKYKEEACKW